MKKIIFLLILVGLGIGGFFYRDAIFPDADSDTLKIVMNTEGTDISPYSLNLNNATRIRNLYEGLVAFDRNLRVIPALAVSWGNLDEKTWEFRLRQGVKFHDGTDMTAQDVVDSFDKAKKATGTQIANYISTIKDISVGSENRIIITTFSPDPLLLSKLTKIYINKGTNVGTGPYKLNEWIRGERFSLSVFPDYWGSIPTFQKVDYLVIRNRTEREQLFADGDIDILVGITEEQAMDLPKEQVITNYGLEVNFLMFQLNNPLFEDRSVREAVQSLIDPKQIEGIGNHFVKSTNQFIAEGVFGYNQNIPAFDYDPANEARNIFGNRLERLTFGYLSSYQTLSQYLTDKLRKAGFSVRANPIGPNALLEKLRKNESQLFLIGWRSEDGDAGGFFDAFIHSDGAMNQGRYKNEEMDELIEKSRTEMDPKKRLALLQEINAKVSEELIGIPLFETSRLYAIKTGIKWQPRLDGLVLSAEVSK